MVEIRFIKIEAKMFCQHKVKSFILSITKLNELFFNIMLIYLSMEIFSFDLRIKLQILIFLPQHKCSLIVNLTQPSYFDVPPNKELKLIS